MKRIFYDNDECMKYSALCQNLYLPTGENPGSSMTGKKPAMDLNVSSVLMFVPRACLISKNTVN